MRCLFKMQNVETSVNNCEHFLVIVCSKVIRTQMDHFKITVLLWNSEHMRSGFLGKVQQREHSSCPWRYPDPFCGVPRNTGSKSKPRCLYKHGFTKLCSEVDLQSSKVSISHRKIVFHQRIYEWVLRAQTPTIEQMIALIIPAHKLCFTVLLLSISDIFHDPKFKLIRNRSGLWTED